jgi:hypothetical protein
MLLLSRRKAQEWQKARSCASGRVRDGLDFVRQAPTHSKNSFFAEGRELTRIGIRGGFWAIVNDVLRFQFGVGHFRNSLAPSWGSKEFFVGVILRALSRAECVAVSK